MHIIFLKNTMGSAVLATPYHVGTESQAYLNESNRIQKMLLVVVVFLYCRAKTNTQIANSANIRRHDLARREEAKDQNKNVA